MNAAAPVHARRVSARKAARRRTVVIVLALLAGLIWPLVGYVQASPASVADPIRITVQNGDTLWALASRYASSGTDIREVVFHIRRANGLRTSVLYPGQVIVIPAGR